MKKQDQPKDEKLAVAGEISNDTALYLGLVSDEKFKELMGISGRTSRRWRQCGYFPFLRLDNKVYYRLKDVRKALEDHYFRNQPLKNRR